MRAIALMGKALIFIDNKFFRCIIINIKMKGVPLWKMFLMF